MTDKPPILPRIVKRTALNVALAILLISGVTLAAHTEVPGMIGGGLLYLYIFLNRSFPND
jgi:hypothetical protein